MASLVTLYLLASLQSVCFRSTVEELCCPSAIAIRARKGPQVADAALQACASSLGCGRAWSVNMMCGK
jgi:hypothetical protein